MSNHRGVNARDDWQEGVSVARPCVQCGKALSRPTQQMYCSRACAKRASYLRTRKLPASATAKTMCVDCGVAYTRKMRATNSRYCPACSERCGLCGSCGDIRRGAGRVCRECERVRGREYAAKRMSTDPDYRKKNRLGAAKWSRENPLRVRQNAWKAQGMNPDEALAAWLAAESCAICGGTNRLSVDHCHETGRVRGVLCTACNSALGRFGDDESGLGRALAYVRGTLL